MFSLPILRALYSVSSSPRFIGGRYYLRKCCGLAFWSIVRESQRNTVFREENLLKTEALDQRRKMVYDIESGYNVINKNLAPYEFALMEVSKNLTLSDNDIFHVKYFKPFIKAYKAWNSHVKTVDWGATYQEIDKLYVKRQRKRTNFTGLSKSGF